MSRLVAAIPVPPFDDLAGAAAALRTCGRTFRDKGATPLDLEMGRSMDRVAVWLDAVVRAAPKAKPEPAAEPST
jgi:hypothetical protein